MTGTLRRTRGTAAVLGAICLSLQVSATLSAFHGPDLVTNVITCIWFTCLASVFVILYRQTGDWVFRLPALFIATSYTLFIAYKIWEFHAHAD